MAVAGLGCGCTAPAVAGLGGKFDTPTTTSGKTSGATATASQFSSLEGLTPLQQAKVTELRTLQIPNVHRAMSLLGVAPPTASFADVLRMDVRRIAGSPLNVVRSILLYALFQTGQLIERLPFAYRMANQGVPGAAAIASRSVQLAEVGVKGVREALDLVPASGTSGLGDSTFLTTAAIAAATAAAAAVTLSGGFVLPVLLIAAAAALVYFLQSSLDVNAEVDRLCAQQLATTGIRCTPADFARYHEQLSEQDKSFLDTIGDNVAEGATSVIKYLAIGGAVLVGGVLLFNYLTYRAGKAVLKSPTGRKIVGASVGGALGGPAGARTGMSLASNRRRRTSRK